MASRSDTELLTEHFGYPPVSLLDEIINSINFLAERALNSIEQGLLNAPPASLGFRPSSSKPKKSKPKPKPKPKPKSRSGANGTRYNGAHDEYDNDDDEDQDPIEEEEGEEEDEEGPAPGETDEDFAARRHRAEVESGTHQLETLLWASIDKNFDRFEIYVMRNILCLRKVEMDWLRLGHYEGLDFEGAAAAAAAGSGGGEGNEGADGEGGKLSVDGINRLRRRVQASQRLNCMLVAERARNAALLGEMRRLVGALPGQNVKTEPVDVGTAGAAAGAGVTTGSAPTDSQQPQQQQSQTDAKPKPPFAFLHNKGDLTEGDAERPLTTTTAFSLSQLSALRDLSAALRGVMTALAEPGNGSDDAMEEEGAEGRDREGKKKSWRRERLEYVETATRKHLEQVRGLELGKDGEVRDGGEWDGGGERGLARGEVESLERVVGLLGGGGGSGSGGGAGAEGEDGDRMDES